MYTGVDWTTMCSFFTMYNTQEFPIQSSCHSRTQLAVTHYFQNPQEVDWVLPYIFSTIRIRMCLHSCYQAFRISDPIYLSADECRVLVDINNAVHWLLLHSSHKLIHYRLIQMLFLELCNKEFFV
jgi:hypothetical protein